MNLRRSLRIASAALIVSASVTGGALAQQQRPSPTSMLLAKELIEVKSAMRLFDPLVNGIVEYHRNLFLQTNPNLGRDLAEVAQRLRAEMAPRLVQLEQEVVRIYAEHFTERELKEAVAFYRTPLGKKLISEEPKALDATMKFATEWSGTLGEEVVAKFRAEMKKKGHDMI
jgi:hypothetical protein